MKGGDESQDSVVGQVRQKVTTAGRSGYTVESVSLGALVRIAGAETRDERENRTVIEFAHNGAVIKVVKAGDAASTFRNASLTRFVSPPSAVEVGGSWQQVYPSTAAFVGARITYKLVAVEGDSAKVDFSYSEDDREKPALATGQFVVSVGSGRVAAMSARLARPLTEGAKITSISMKLID